MVNQTEKDNGVQHILVWCEWADVGSLPKVLSGMAFPFTRAVFARMVKLAVWPEHVHTERTTIM